MKSMLTQLHTTHDECESLLAFAGQELQFKVYKVETHPVKLTEYTPAGGFTNEQQLEEVALVLSLTPPQIPPSGSYNEFLDTNPGVVLISIGSYDGKTLNESAIEYLPGDEGSYKAAQKLFREMKKKTKAGVNCVNPDYNAEGLIRTHRYSIGAKELYNSGVTIRPLTGENSRQYLQLPD